jgi:pimeloyl-ACP methyl ester carboxylesterase
MGMMASEYSLIEKVNVLRGLMDSFFVIYPQLQDIDLRQDAAQLNVPVYIIQGKYELSARADLVPDYYERLQAPIKRLIMFDESAHAPAHEEFGRFHQLMLDTILPETYPGS